MNYVDTREPDDLTSRLTKLPGWDCKFLETGDYSIDDFRIGVERKTWIDLLQRINPRSREDNLRPLSLKDQLGRMVKDYKIIVLLLEGWAGVTWQGNLKTETREHGFTYCQVQHYLLSIQDCGVRIITSPNTAETVRELTTLSAFYSQEHTPISDYTMPRGMSILEVMLSAIPKLGYQKVKAISSSYNSMGKLLLASPQELQSIPGIGKTISERIWSILHD